MIYTEKYRETDDESFEFKLFDASTSIFYTLIVRPNSDLVVAVRLDIISITAPDDGVSLYGHEALEFWEQLSVEVTGEYRIQRMRVALSFAQEALAQE